jgi:hypothetical protein
MRAFLRGIRSLALLLITASCEGSIREQPPGAFSPSAAGTGAVIALPPTGVMTQEPAVTAAPPVVEDLATPPALLSQTGLFSDMATQAAGAGVELYLPSFELWSDNAAKRRWALVPPGTQIDTTDMDHWIYPVGTKIWKEFGLDGRALETRYMVKFGPNDSDWKYLSYQWDEANSDAYAVPEGVENAGGTTHDIPSSESCMFCHNGRPASALGFTALQLSHNGPGLTIDTLAASGKLTQPPPAPLRVPGDEVAQRALGYLHANCGGCHNETSAPSVAGSAKVVFWQSATRLASVEQTTTYVNMVLETNGNLHSLMSGVDRMRPRPVRQMPPVATEFVDADGVAVVDAWVQQLLQQFPQPATAP